MKKVFSLLLSLTMVMALLAGCGGDTTADDTTDDTASNDAAQEETAELSGTVATDGSTSMEEVIGALGEQFMADNSGVSVTYNPTGSGAGIEAVSNGSCDIGLASRALTDDEKAGGLTETIVALDGIAVVVESMGERETPNGPILDVEANIFCEKDSHKGMVIGKRGAMLKEIATLARQDMEALFGAKVNLQCWVKVKEDWRNRQGLLNSFGYRE